MTGCRFRSEMNAEGQADQDYWNAKYDHADECVECDSELLDTEDGPQCNWCTTGDEGEDA